MIVVLHARKNTQVRPVTRTITVLTCSLYRKGPGPLLRHGSEESWGCLKFTNNPKPVALLPIRRLAECDNEEKMRDR